MKDLITIRIYFELGQKINNETFLKKLFPADFSAELIKRAKSFGLKQVLHLHVSKGYLDHQDINWGINEIRHHKHPHIIEIVDSEEKINAFLEKEKTFLNDTHIIIVKNNILIKH